jgi:hypothetical protein
MDTCKICDFFDVFDDVQLKYLKIVYGALVQQLNSYGIVLTLLAAVTSVAILQSKALLSKGTCFQMTLWHVSWCFHLCLSLVHALV